MSWAALLVLVVCTYGFRITGPLLRDRVTVPARIEQLLADAATVLLVGLVAVSALTDGQQLAGAARPAGVLVALVLVLRRVPFPVVVIAAAATTALLRWVIAG